MFRAHRPATMLVVLATIAVTCMTCTTGIRINLPAPVPVPQPQEQLSFTPNTDPTKYQFTFLGGKTTPDVQPATDGSYPGARDSGVQTRTPTGDYFLFGGFGPDLNNTVGWLCDSWIRSKDGTWKRLPGAPPTADTPGQYPTVPGKYDCEGGSCYPGSRSGTSLVPTNLPDVYALWGGFGFGSNATQGKGKLSDFWLLDLSANATSLWTFIGGNTTIGALGVYGAKGVASPSNSPGGRVGFAYWNSPDPEVHYFFGGWGYGTVPDVRGALSDVWKLELTVARQDTGFVWTYMWTWVSGPSKANTPGYYPPPPPASNFTSPTPTPSPYMPAPPPPPPSSSPTPGIAEESAADLVPNPNGRYGIQFWDIGNGDGYILGGFGRDATNALGFMNDFWHWNSTSTEWTWLSGYEYINGNGDYGTLGQPSATTNPPARYGGHTWDDNSNLYMYAGSHRSDLWRWNMETKQWTWFGGGNDYNAHGTYGAVGAVSPTVKPGSRYGSYVWPTDNIGEFLVYGGFGGASWQNSTLGGLDDEWLLTTNTRAASRVPAAQVKVVNRK